MTTQLDIKFLRAAHRIIQTHGTSCTITRNTGAYDEATATVTETPSSMTIKCSPPGLIESEYWQDSTIKERAKCQVIVEPQDPGWVFTPDEGMQLLLSGESSSYLVVAAQPLRGGDVVCAYMLALNK